MSLTLSPSLKIKKKKYVTFIENSLADSDEKKCVVNIDETI